MKRILSYAAFVSVIVAIVVPMSAQAIDTITLKKNKKTVEGRFEAYKSNRFYFVPISGKKIHEMRNKVISLTLDPPSRVSIKARGAKKAGALSFKGFSNGKFFFDSAKGELKLAGMAVTVIKMELDFNRKGMMHDVALVVSKGEEVDISSKLSDGVATVVQFHKADIPSSIRQGTYVHSMTRDSKGKIRLLKVVLPDWNCAVAKQYGIKSAPQFWFYGKDGSISEKLVERFTESDIETAAKKVMRGK